MKSLRTRRFVEDNGIWLVWFVEFFGLYWVFLFGGLFGFFFLVLILDFLKHSDRDYYKILRRK